VSHYIAVYTEGAFLFRGLTDESEILKFLQHGTLVGLLPVPHPILIRKYQANSGTTMWFRTYMWGIIYLRSVPISVPFSKDRNHLGKQCGRMCKEENSFS